MSALTKCLILFALNWLDAQLTIVWVREGWATEGNGLMAHLLEAGDVPFLLVKLTVGALVACIFYRWSHLTLARRGTALALGLYTALMFVHAATGLSALGWHPSARVIAYISYLPEGLLAFIS